MNNAKNEGTTNSNEYCNDRRLWIGNLDPRITDLEDQLHNKQIGTKNIVVTWPHSVSNEEPEKIKTVNIPALAMAKLEKKLIEKHKLKPSG
ncbi:hypothetical protein RN001_007144 [Aquatica leii]|uniref:Uncharacterized protein n=1 Tax=Aquatica leii TaxID=1421715 RepID=A0AAN7SNR8_9COLE|nr:hypothetical protein RN001_007144 [Aquatica leii]